MEHLSKLPDIKIKPPHNFMLLRKNIFGFLIGGWQDRGKQAYYHNDKCNFCGENMHVAVNINEEKRVLYCPICMFVQEGTTQ